MSFQSSCPTCGTPIEFAVDTSLVCVCESCDSIVGRGGGKLESYGKVSDLAQTDSPLQVGVEGRIKGIPFEITGHTQLRHAGGGVWDEWYLSVRGGDRWGWLSESQGRYHITFQQKMPDDVVIPDPRELTPSDSVTIPRSGIMTVSEVGEASIIAAEGEIPFLFRPGEMYAYADLSGGGRKFATIDGSTTPPQVYSGAEVTLEQIGIDEAVLDRDREERQVDAAGVNCPQCGGTLELTLPDQAERVACPYCDSLLDANQGNLQFLKKLGEGPKPLIPLGSVGTLDGKEFKVIGFVQKMVREDGMRYFWTEYLLYSRRNPFYWLVHSNNHWTLGTGVPAGEVTSSHNSARCKGRSYRVFEKGQAEVTHVLGEFYWKVNVGDTSITADFVSPPMSLSCERDHFDADTGEQVSSKEINWTLSRYIHTAEIEKAFNIRVVHPSGPGPSQPFDHRGIYLLWLMTVGAALLLGAMFHTFSGKREILTETIGLPAETKSSVSRVTKAFPLKSLRNVRINVRTNVLNSWAYVDGSLYNEDTGKSYPVTVPIEVSEGGKKKGSTKFVSAVPKGTYRLNMKLQWQNMSMAGVEFKIGIRQGVRRGKYLLYLIIALSVVPLFMLIAQMTFATRRWQNSDYSPFS